MKVINTVTYTQYDKTIKAHVENRIQLPRTIKLSESGAQNILRKLGYKDAIVTRVESMIEAQ